ncbi:hypothetical protein CCP3SC1AL1_2140002 [Gammaproteobacteria bacterium]
MTGKKASNPSLLYEDPEILEPEEVSTKEVGKVQPKIDSESFDLLDNVHALTHPRIEETERLRKVVTKAEDTWRGSHGSRTRKP